MIAEFLLLRKYALKFEFINRGCEWATLWFDMAYVYCLQCLPSICQKSIKTKTLWFLINSLPSERLHKLTVNIDTNTHAHTHLQGYLMSWICTLGMNYIKNRSDQNFNLIGRSGFRLG